MVEALIAPVAPVAAAPAAPVVETPPASTAPVVPVDGSPVVPAALPAATITPPAAPAQLSPEQQDYVYRIQQENAQARQQALMVAHNEFITKQTGELEAEGVPTETARRLAERTANATLQRIQSDEFRQGQVNAAIEIAGQYKIDPRDLMNLPSPQAMHQAAQAATSQGQAAAELKVLRDKVAAFEVAEKKRAAPPQTFASGAVSGDGTRVTDQNIDTLYYKDPVRYRDVYSRFLKTGQIS